MPARAGRAQALGGRGRCGRRRERRPRGPVVGLGLGRKPDRAVGGLGRPSRGGTRPLGVGRVALGALGERRHPGGTGAGLVGERPPAGLETRMALVGSLRLGPPPGDDVLEARHRRLEIGPPPFLDLEVVCGHVGGRISAGELVCQRVAAVAAASRAWAWALAQAVWAAASSARAAASAAAVVAAWAAALRQLGVGLAGGVLVGRERRGQPVALGPGGHPRRLARVGRRATALRARRRSRRRPG